MSWRLVWQVNGKDFVLTMPVSNEIQKTALRDLRDGLIATGHTAVLSRETDAWVEVEYP